MCSTVGVGNSSCFNLVRQRRVAPSVPGLNTTTGPRKVMVAIACPTSSTIRRERKSRLCRRRVKVEKRRSGTETRQRTEKLNLRLLPSEQRALRGASRAGGSPQCSGLDPRDDRPAYGRYLLVLSLCRVKPIAAGVLACAGSSDGMQRSEICGGRRPASRGRAAPGWSRNTLRCSGSRSFHARLGPRRGR